MIVIPRHVFFAYGIKLDDAVARITPDFFHVLNHHAAWWRLLFEILMISSIRCFYLWHFFYRYWTSWKKALFCKRESG
jgi:hypothetical protein